MPLPAGWGGKPPASAALRTPFRPDRGELQPVPAAMRRVGPHGGLLRFLSYGLAHGCLIAVGRVGAHLRCRLGRPYSGRMVGIKPRLVFLLYRVVQLRGRSFGVARTSVSYRSRRGVDMRLREHAPEVALASNTGNCRPVALVKQFMKRVNTAAARWNSPRHWQSRTGWWTSCWRKKWPVGNPKLRKMRNRNAQMGWRVTARAVLRTHWERSNPAVTSVMRRLQTRPTRIVSPGHSNGVMWMAPTVLESRPSYRHNSALVRVKIC